MAWSKRSRNLSGTQFDDAFILPKGRSVIKGFDADDGDFIGVPSNATFKLLKRNSGVLIKSKGFRSMVKGVTVAEVEDSLEVLEIASGWDQFKDQGVIVQTAPGRLIFSGTGNVTAPSDYYKDWTVIDITGEVSFPGEGMVLDGGDTAVSLQQYEKLGYIKIDGGGGKDVIHLGPPISASSEGSIDPKNIELIRLDNGSQRWSIDGEHPDMSVEIWDGGIEITGDTRLNKISVVLNDELMKTLKQSDVRRDLIPDRDFNPDRGFNFKPNRGLNPDRGFNPDRGLNPESGDVNKQRQAFVVAKTGKGGGAVDFNEVFASETNRLVVDPRMKTCFPASKEVFNGIGLLQGEFENLTFDSLFYEDEQFERHSSGMLSWDHGEEVPATFFYYGGDACSKKTILINGISDTNIGDQGLSSELLDGYSEVDENAFDKLYFSASFLT